MKTEPKTGTIDAGTFHVMAVRDLQPLIDSVEKGLNADTKAIFRDMLVKRPVTFWTETYLLMARELAESLYLAAFYAKKERLAAHQGVIDDAKEYSKLHAQKHSVARQLMITLQLTPSMIYGEARNHRGAVVEHQKASEILNDVNEDDLYA